MILETFRKALKLGLLATTSFAALVAPADAAPVLLLAAPQLFGAIAIWGTSIGLSLTGVTALVTAVTAGINLAVGVGLSLLGSVLFAPEVPKPEDRQVLVREPTQPRQRAYGRVKVGGTLAYLAVSGGALYRLIVMGTGEIDAVEEHWIDDNEVTFDGSGNVTAPSQFAGRINIQYRLGTDSQTAYADLIARFPSDWTSAHQGNGMSHALVRLNAIKPEKFGKTYPRGEPNYRQVQRAAKLYDPREVSHDWNDESTWEWSENAALCILDYLVHPDGLGLPKTLIDPDEFIAAANVCDEVISLKAGGTVARWKTSNVYSYDERPADVLSRMLLACDGVLLPTPAGGLTLKVGKWEAPTVTITEAAILNYDVGRGKNIVEGANVIKARFTSPDHDYAATDADEWRDEDDVTARGELVASIDYFCAPNHSQCRRLQKLAAARLNPSWSGTLTLNMMGLAVMGERFITVQMDELGIDETFEITGDPEFILGENNTLTGIRINVSSLSSAAYDFDPATEEGTAPAVPGDPSSDNSVEDMVDLAVAVQQRTVSGSTKVAVGLITWDAPANDGLTPQIQIKLDSGSDATWQSLAVAPDLSQTETGVLIDGEDYNLRGRFMSPTGIEGDWTTEVDFTAVANLTAPAVVTGVMLTGGNEQVTLAFNTPNDVNFVKARIYRNSANDSSTATLIQTIYLAPSIAANLTVTGQPSGTWHYWVAASNGSNIEAARVAGTPASVLVLGPELVTSGDFASGTGWTAGAGWSIGSGKATHSAGSAGDLSQAITLVAAGTYRLVFTLSGFAGGTVTPQFTGGSTVTGTARSADGAYSEDLVAASGNTTLVLAADTAGSFDIDNVSVRRIG